MKAKIWILAVLAGAVLLGGCTGNTSDNDKKTESVSGKQESSGTNASSGKSDSLPLPVTFEAADMEGNEVSSSIFSESKLTMINVWATYCNPCLQEMPDLGELSGEYDSGEFQIIGVISDVQEGADQDTLDKASSLIEQTGADYPHLLLNESLYEAMLTEVTAVPTTFFFDSNGMVLDTLVGSRDKDEWKEIIDALLEKK
ncbi:MAG: TlpA disulfide reductase family protein [Blautia sp.]|nr:TlpA family protein disulfide reductase [Blautia sp.]MDY5663432.1 TlpA disulfide reductase family protein [Blautia sp.]